MKAAAVGAAFQDVGSSFSDLGGSIKSAITSTTLLVGAVAGAAGGFAALVTHTPNPRQHSKRRPPRLASRSSNFRNCHSRSHRTA